MEKLHKPDFNKISTYRKVFVITCLIASIIWGIMGSVISIVKFVNYNHPYIFGFILGTLGLIIGIIISIKFKQRICISQKMYSDYVRTPIFIVAGFIGTFLYLGVNLNQSLSSIEKCDNYEVIDKLFIQGRSRQPSKINLYLNVEGKVIVLACNKKYWDTVAIGQTVNICFYKSKIGFDYIILTDEKK